LGQGGTLGPDLTGLGKGRNIFELIGLFWSHSSRMIEMMKEKGAPYPTLSQAEMESLLTYLYALSYFDEAGDYFAGERLFQEKGCIKCHSVGDQGGHVAPALDGYANLVSPAYLTQAVWNHGAKMAAKMAELGVERPKLRSAEIAHLIAYIQGAAAGVPEFQIVLSPGNPKRGEALFKEKGCLQCHLKTGEEKILGPDLSRGEIQGMSVGEITERLWNHGLVMWSQMKELNIPVSTFEGQEMADLIAYIHFLSYAAGQGDPKKGGEIFVSKGCVVCHAFDEKERTGPDLFRSAVAESPSAIATAMWNHAPLMKEAIAEAALEWPQFEQSEMQDLIAYLRPVRRDGN
jgi:cytochrome c2